ncbi:MAG TPA: IPT/TIG domain-containing protein [Gemmatimonadaceae bacterium]|nr:IPT/TIG domain-containing protein [Gemmatimonadaceae bacterium]
MRGRTASLSYIAGFAVFAVAATTCSDLTAPAGLKGAVSIAYAGPPEAIGGAIRVTVGQKLSPAFRVSLSGITQTRARYVLSLAQPRDSSVLKIFGSESDSVEVVGDGSATLVATLVVATVGPDTAHSASVSVIASPPSNPLPTLTGIAPAFANRLQTLDVVFTGTGFIAGVSRVNVGAGITVNTMTVNSSTEITANISIGGSAASGARAFSVANAAPGGGTSATKAFTVTDPPPTIVSVSPTSAVQGQTNVAVTVTGSNFVAGTTVAFGATVTVSRLAVVNSTTLTATLTVAAGATTGFRDVIVTNGATAGGAATLTNGFTVAAPAAPSISLLSPASGRVKAKLTVTITGSNFYSGVTTFSFGDKIDVNSVSVTSPTKASVSISIGKPAAVGPRSVTVRNTPPGGSQTQQSAFTVLP